MLGLASWVDAIAEIALFLIYAVPTVFLFTIVWLIYRAYKAGKQAKLNKVGRNKK